MSTQTSYPQQKYGAVELKLAYQRNMLMAMAIAFTVQVGLVLSLGLFGGEIPQGRKYVKFGGSDRGGGREWISPPMGQLPRQGSPGVRKAIAHAIPVPVSEARAAEVPVEQPEPSPGPPGTGGGGPDPEGVPGGNPPIDIPDPEPPEPWVYVEKEPVVIRSVVPVYPPLALKSGLEGRVMVRMWVGKDGRVRKVEVVKSDFEILSEAAVEAAKQFVFTPAYVTGGPVEVWVAVPFDFRLANAR